MQERITLWVTTPLAVIIVVSCLALVVSDAVGQIPPLGTGLITLCTTVLVSGVLSGPAFGWLFDRKL